MLGDFFHRLPPLVFVTTIQAKYFPYFLDEEMLASSAQIMQQVRAVVFEQGLPNSDPVFIGRKCRELRKT